MDTIIRMNLIGMYGILLVLIVRLLLKKISYRYVYALWMVSFLVLVLPAGIPVGFSIVPRAIVQSELWENMHLGTGGKEVDNLEAGNTGYGFGNQQGQLQAAVDNPTQPGIIGDQGTWPGTIGNQGDQSEIAGNQGTQSGMAGSQGVHIGMIGNQGNQPGIMENQGGQQGAAGNSGNYSGTLDGSNGPQEITGSWHEQQENTGQTSFDVGIGGKEQFTEPNPEANAAGMIAVGFWLGLVWSLGVVILSIREILRYRRLRRYILRQEVVNQNGIQIAYNQRNATEKVICSKVESKSGSLQRVIILKGLDTPFVLGFFRPIIYLPDHMAEGERAYILAHEQYHCRRKDSLMKAVAMGITFAYWYNPIVWLGYYFLCVDMELSCDEAVLKQFSGTIKRDYAESLLKYGAMQNRYILSVLTFGEPSLKSRIQNVLHYKRKSVIFTGCAVALVVCVALGLICRPREVGTGTEGMISSEDTLNAAGTSASYDGKADANTNEGTQEGTHEDIHKQDTQNTDWNYIKTDIGDLDGNGVNEYILVAPPIDPEKYKCSGQFFWNDVCVYEYQSVLALTEASLGGYLDLDQDGQNELCLIFEEHEESYRYREWVVLKQRNGSWEKIERGETQRLLEELLPVKITCGEDYTAVISCEGSDKEIIFDLAPFWADAYRGSHDVLQAAIESDRQNFKQGEVYSEIDLWSGWRLKPGIYDQKNCMIASISVYSGMGNYFPLGVLDVYFGQDEAGNMQIYDMYLNPYVNGQSYVGTWHIDVEKTESKLKHVDSLEELVGEDLRYGNALVFSEDGTMYYFIGRESEGRTYTYGYAGGEVVAKEVVPEHLSGNPEEITLIRNFHQEQTHLMMEWKDEIIFWKREEIPKEALIYNKMGEEVGRDEAKRQKGNGFTVLIPEENWVYSQEVIDDKSAEVWTYIPDNRVKLYVVSMGEVSEKEASDWVVSQYDAQYTWEGLIDCLDADTDDGCMDAAISRLYETHVAMSFYPAELEEWAEPRLRAMRYSLLYVDMPNVPAEFSYAALADQEFHFGSGTGAWSTELVIHEDGTFTGNFHDADSTTHYVCDFTGKLSEPVRINAYMWSARVEEITEKREPDTTERKNGNLYIYSTAYGMDEAEEIIFYMPGTPTSVLPEGFQSWMHGPRWGSIYIRNQMNCYGLYNVKEEEGFTSFPKGF